jgi:transposase-like protein
MPRPRKYPEELLDRSVRLVLESGPPIAHVAADLSIHPETLRKRVRQAEADAPSGASMSAPRLGTSGPPGPIARPPTRPSCSARPGKPEDHRNHARRHEAAVTTSGVGPAKRLDGEARIGHHSPALYGASRQTAGGKTDSVARDEISHGFDLQEPSALGDPPGNRERRTGSRLSVRRASTSAS